MVADYSMADDKWEQYKTQVMDWFDMNPDYTDRKNLVEMLFQLGDGEPLFRKRHWQSIRSVFLDVANRPFGGKPDIMSLQEQADLNQFIAHFIDECIAIYNTMPCFANIACLRHPKSRSPIDGSGMRYDSADEYAETMGRNMRVKLRSAFSNHFHQKENKNLYWDGSYTDGLPDPTPRFEEE
jgi:hypothetical protein